MKRYFVNCPQMREGISLRLRIVDRVPLEGEHVDPLGYFKFCVVFESGGEEEEPENRLEITTHDLVRVSLFGPITVNVKDVLSEGADIENIAQDAIEELINANMEATVTIEGDTFYFNINTKYYIFNLQVAGADLNMAGLLVLKEHEQE